MTCPTCGDTTRGQCRKPACLAEDLRAETVLDQRCEVDE